MRLRWLVLALVGGLLLASPAAQAGPQDAAANRLFVEAVKLSERADAERDSVRRRDLLREAFARLERIVDEFPDSDLAVKLITGEAIGRFDPGEVRERLDEAERAAAATQVANNAAKPKPAAAAVKLPTQAVDANTVEGRILAAVVGTLENLLNASMEAPKLEFREPIAAEREGEQVLLRFLGTKLKAAEGGADLGNFLLAVTPRGDGRYGFALNAPTLIRLLDAKGKEEGQISYSEPRAKGIYWPELNTFERFDMALGAFKVVELKGNQKKTTAEIASLSLDQVYAEEAGQRFGGRTAFNLAGLKIYPPDGTAIELGKFAMAMKLSDLDLTAAKQYFEKFGGGPFGPSSAGLSSEQALKLAREQMKELASLIETSGLGRMSGELSLAGLKHAEKGKPQYSLEDAALRLGLDTTQRFDTLSLAFEMGKLQTADKTMPAGLAPNRLLLDLTVERAPIRSVLVYALSSMRLGEPGVDPAELINPDEVMDIAMKAEPIVKLTALNVTTPLIEVTMSGQLAFDRQTPNLVSGGLDGMIRGLDKAMKTLNEQAKKDPEAKQLLSVLVLLKGVGRPEIQAGGEAAYSYRIEMSSDGPTVNGTPVDQLMQ